MSHITVDGQEYNLDDLSDKARQHVQAVQFADQRLQQLQMEQALCQSARNAYAQELAPKLPEKEAHPNKKKGVITIDEKKYELEDFSEEGQKVLRSVQMSEQKVNQLQNDIALLKTGRSAHAQALAQEIKQVQ